MKGGCGYTYGDGGAASESAMGQGIAQHSPFRWRRLSPCWKDGLFGARGTSLSIFEMFPAQFFNEEPLTGHLLQAGSLVLPQ